MAEIIASSSIAFGRNVTGGNRPDLKFEFTLTVKDDADDDLPNFLGPLSQGPAKDAREYVKQIERRVMLIDGRRLAG